MKAGLAANDVASRISYPGQKDHGDNGQGGSPPERHQRSVNLIQRPEDQARRQGGDADGEVVPAISQPLVLAAH